MYKRSFTMQKNPAKLFENGLMRFAEVCGLYLPLGFLVEKEVEDKYAQDKKKMEVHVNPHILKVSFHLAYPHRIEASQDKITAIDEVIVQDVVKDDEREKGQKGFNSVLYTYNVRDEPGYSDCLTYFSVQLESDAPTNTFTGSVRSPLVNRLEFEIANRAGIEQILKDFPPGDMRYNTPRSACSVEVTMFGDNLSGINEASKILVHYFEKIQRER